MKTFLKSLAAIALVLLVLLLLHPLWIGPVVRTAVSSLVPRFLGVPAHLDGFALNAYTGRLAVDGFALDNPPECGPEKFVSIGHLCVDVDPTSVLSDLIVIEEISAQDFLVSFMTDRSGTYNFTIVGSYAGSRKASEAEPVRAKEPKEEAGSDGQASPRMVVDLLEIRNSVVKWSNASFPLPSFRMTGVGRSCGGLEFDDMRKEVRHRFFEQLGPVAQGLSAILDAANGTANGEDVRSIIRNVRPIARSARVVSDTTKAAGSVVDAGVNVLGEGTKALDDGAKALKALFGK